MQQRILLMAYFVTFVAAATSCAKSDDAVGRTNGQTVVFNPGDPEDSNGNDQSDAGIGDDGSDNNADPGPTQVVAQRAAPDLNEFVTRAGSKLMLGGKTFRYSGANVYWLANAAEQQVREAYATVVAMGGLMVRSNSLGNYICSPKSIEPTLNTFNEAGFKPIDYAIYMAGQYGLKLQIPLTDNYASIFNSKYCFLRWRNLKNGHDFYTNEQVVGDFKNYINHLLNHVNPYNGFAYKDDPTIAIWETGNEFGGWHFKEGAPPTSFTKQIADYIKSIDQHHLVLDGSDGINKAALAIDSVDIYSDHFYWDPIGKLSQDQSMVIGAGKVLVIGEYAWRGAAAISPLATLLQALENSQAAGDSYWSLFVHDAACKGFVQHADSPTENYTMHYPGDSADMKTRMQQLRAHAYRMQGKTAPSNMPSVPCPTPVP